MSPIQRLLPLLVLAGCSATAHHAGRDGAARDGSADARARDAAPRDRSTGDSLHPDGSGDGRAPDAAAGRPPATLADYWHGRASWELLRSYEPKAGNHISIVGEVWYLFSRTVHPGEICNGTERLGTEVRASHDHGVSWSAPVEILVPRDGTPWACAATDGDAVFDAATGTWHYLFQCLAKSGPWQGCHAQLRAANPTSGEFVAVLANPVIPAGSLWRRICDQPGDDCVSIPGAPGLVYDEGTFNIFLHEGGYYYVSFHGYDGARGYRGIARTRDFASWDAGDPSLGVPADAVLDVRDQAGWREDWLLGGPIGFGAGSIVREGPYFYLISEGADLNLACLPGQNWDWGLFRSRSLTSTRWESLPAGNPFIYSSREREQNGQSMPCNPAYARLLREPATGEMLLHYTRTSMDGDHSRTFLYHLVPRHNLLINGDLWMCTSEAWWRFPIGNTNLVVYRLPRQSADDGCFLATNCGAPTCTPGQSVYQDVPLAGVRARRLAFGGVFASEGGPATVTVALFQLSAEGAVLTNSALAVSLGGSTYQPARQEVVLLPNAATLRFQLYLQDPATLHADRMFIEVLD